MSLKRVFYVFYVSFFCISCKSYDQFILYQDHVDNFNLNVKKSKLTTFEWKNWQHKDYINDTIAGISLEKAYEKILSNKKKPEKITLALIDGRLDMMHEDIKDSFWTNSREIPNNKIDDDNNGYIDDIHGWNYLGNKDGTQLYRSPYEYIRIIKKYDPIFKNKNHTDITEEERDNYKTYLRALDSYKRKKLIVDDNLFYLDSLLDAEKRLKTEIQDKYPDQRFINESFIDSLIKLENDQKDKFLDYKSLIKNKDWVKKRRIAEERYLTYYLNKDYDDREIIGDKEDEIEYKKYGNANVSIDSTENRHSHAIQMIGIITGDRLNKLGILGITNQVKIMPIAVAPYGEAHDKDIALAIRYAVDNGAKLINMSLGKEFSLYEDWVVEAIKYAEINDVLIVTSSGNNGMNLDIKLNYPNDSKKHSKEFVNNFIKVGATTFKANENLVYSSSNYGKKEVDIFAPGQYIYTTRNNDKYDYSSGTSCSSAIVTGIAALIRSYYPDLTATEVKEIILKTGTKYNLMVNIPVSINEKTKKVPFSSLSKSGKIVNAYNALLMAEEISKKKKKRKRK